MTAGGLLLPFRVSAALSDEQRRDVIAIAERANDRYLHEVIEGHAFCPFARQGRESGGTVRHVWLATEPSLEPVLEMFRDAAARPEIEVVQVVFPLVEVEPEAFRRFVGEVTALGNERVPEGRPVFACAALHPALSYRDTTPSTLIPLFRRAPDATIQWVRLSALDAIYEGRRGGTSYVDLERLAEFLTTRPERDLYAQIASTNRETARRLGVSRVAAQLRVIREEAEAAYRRVLEA